MDTYTIARKKMKEPVNSLQILKPWIRISEELKIIWHAILVMLYQNCG